MFGGLKLTFYLESFFFLYTESKNLGPILEIFS